MRIGFNLVAFLPGSMGGMETYCKNLLYALQEVDQDNRYTVLCDTHYTDEILIRNPHFTIVPCNYSRPSFGWLLRGLMRNVIGIDILTPFMNRLDVDVIHHPFSFLNPLQSKIPSVLTFHDMQHEFFPEYFSFYEMKIRKELYRPSPGRATRVIAISEHAKSCLVEKYGISPTKIAVIYNGYNPIFQKIVAPDALERIRLKYGLDRPFMYYPAATWPHKNHKRLLAALNLMKHHYGFDGQLVLSGIAMQSQSEIYAEISRLDLQKDVTFLGYLPQEDLPGIYNLARLLIFPSLFEGFGQPLVEAMASGCPVACSSVTAIPEVVGTSGLFFDPTSIDDIAEKAWTLWTGDELRGQLSGAGLQRAKMFSWKEAARKTVSVYREVAIS